MAFGKSKRGSGSSGGRFEYKERTADAYKARQSIGGTREGFLVDGVKVFTPKSGDFTVRILPPTWDSPGHYGLDVFAHFGVGPDEGAYLCLDKMKGEVCAICDERKQAVAADESELAEALKWRRRVLCWVIDRDNESEGPMLWPMPQTLDKDISAVCQDKKTKEVYSPDHPYEGYDVSFKREGKGLGTKYVGVQLDRRASPLSDDEDTAKEWLDFVQKNPVPDQLVYQKADYLESLVGTSKPRDADNNRKEKDKDSDDERKSSKRSSERSSGRSKDRDEESDDRSGSKKGATDKAEDLTWDDIHSLGEEDLQALADEHDVDVSDAKDEEAAADLICEALEIEAPRKSRRNGKEDDKGSDDEGEQEPRRPSSKRGRESEDKEEKPKASSRLAQLRAASKR